MIKVNLLDKYELNQCISNSMLHTYLSHTITELITLKDSLQNVIIMSSLLFSTF